MPLEFRFSARPERDLLNLATWISGQADTDVARAYVIRVRSACRKIVDRPNGGTPQPKIGGDYRSVVFERRLLILYRLEKETIVIKRIVHGSRDLSRALRRRS